MDYTPFEITLKLAVFTTIILIVIGIPLAYLLAYSKWKIKFIFESIFMLPIVLPPTVLGYYYISYLGPNSSIGAFFYDTLGLDMVFSFQGILIGSVIYCMPFMISPLVAGFRAVPRNLIESTIVLGKSKFSALWFVILPYVKTSLWSAILLTFAHTIGEFGMVLMIGGNLPETKVASIAIYDEMNQLNFDYANQYAMILLATSFSVILILTYFSRKNKSFIA